MRIRDWSSDVCSSDLEPGALRTSAGFTVQASHGLHDLAEADIVVVPSWRDTGEPAPPALLQALRQAHARGALLVGLCLEIGRASCRERVCQYVSFSVVAVFFQPKKHMRNEM